MPRAKKTKKTSLEESPPVIALDLDTLHRACDPKSLGFKTTDELPALTDVIGQPRAFRAMELGTEVLGSGFNIFVLADFAQGAAVAATDDQQDDVDPPISRTQGFIRAGIR